MKKRIGNAFWNSSAAARVFAADSAEEVLFHAPLAQMVAAFHPRRVLDYGCGDGALVPFLESGIELGLYDLNFANANLAASKSRAVTTRLYENPDAIEKLYYDLAVLSFVVVCLPNEQEFIAVLRRIRACLRAGGMLIVADGHPCFRDRKFVGHRAVYTKAFPFDYNNRFHEFLVRLKGAQPRAEFYDYHWTIADLTNIIIRSGFKIDSLHEIPDRDLLRHAANRLYPPYLFIRALKDT